MADNSVEISRKTAERKDAADKANKGKGKKPAVAKTPRQLEIDVLRAIDKSARTEQQQQKLDQMLMAEKRDRFTRLVAKRVDKANKAIVNVARLGNRASYNYTDNEAVRIVEYIGDSFARMRDAFTGKKEDEKGFTL